MTKDKKNLLLIMHVIPSDSGMGVQKRAAAHLRALSAIRQVYLLVFEAQPGLSAPLDSSLAELCEFVNVIPAPERSRKVLFSSPPFATISEIFSPRTERMVPEKECLLEAVKHINHIIFDDAFCFRIRSALILERILMVTSIKVKRKIVDYDDIESFVHIRSNAFSPPNNGFEQNIIEKIMLRRLKNIENKFLNSFQSVLVCSDLDKETLEGCNPAAEIHVVPNSVPLGEISNTEKHREKFHILFVGTMSYGPNEDGILWFCNKILPLIRERTKFPLSLYVVGFKPPQSVLNLAQAKDITVTGGVDSVEPYYQNSDIVIAPIRYGGGTRIKILEAMGYQRPVISTTIGAEGIDIENGKDILIADSPDDFAKACVRLIEDEKLCKNMGVAARKNIEQKYSDNVISRKLQQIIE